MSEEKNMEIQAEKPEKKVFFTENRLEIVIAIFLAITALLTAWATWIGSLHGGNQATNYAKSNNKASEGTALYNEGAQNLMQASLVWNTISNLQLDFMTAQSKNDQDTIETAAYKIFCMIQDNYLEYPDILAALSIDLDEFVQAGTNNQVTEYITYWMEQPGALVSPLTEDIVNELYFSDAYAVMDESQEILVQGQKDNANGDSYNLVTVFYSVVMFLLGIAGTFKNLTNRKIIIIIALVSFVIGTLYMLTIPMPTGFDISSFLSH